DMGTDESVRKFGMDLRYRVLPRCFGQYRVCGETIRSAEIEQVCVATNSLSYEAYIECRRLHLMVSIFYNDAVFGGLLKLFRALGVSVFRWLEILRDTRYEGDLAGLIARFEDDTRNELWAERETLAQLIQQDGVIERYIDGELGLNLLFTYKSIAMTRHVSELEVLARRAAHELLEEVGQDAGKILDFVDDVLRFDSARMTNLFDETEAPVRRVLRHDIDAFLGSDGQAALSDFRLPGARTVEFLMNDDQRAVLERGLTLFGDDDAGIGRILSKFHIARFLRRPARSARVGPHETTDATLGAEHFAPQINFHDA
ncbi:MAG: hypothetical protein O7H40_10440, partial [Gammaproteobacteria bacterium]|nr:hypothetical protein [Gammaproteobacteria bacterium]